MKTRLGQQALQWQPERTPQRDRETVRRRGARVMKIAFLPFLAQSSNDKMTIG
jgi:hypothetical protein